MRSMTAKIPVQFTVSLTVGDILLLIAALGVAALVEHLF